MERWSHGHVRQNLGGMKKKNPTNFGFIKLSEIVMGKKFDREGDPMRKIKEILGILSASFYLKLWQKHKNYLSM